MYFGEAVLRLFGAKAIMNAGQATRGKAWLKVAGATADEQAALARAAGTLDDVATAAASVAANAKHAAWGQDLGAINSTIAKLGRRALRESGGDWRLSEELFERYLQGISSRLSRTGSKYAVEIQPAANANGRVWNFIEVWENGRWSSKLYPFPGSRRLDAGVVDLTSQPNSFGLRPLLSGFDITLNVKKPNIVSYYQEYFGNIPIFDLRIR